MVRKIFLFIILILFLYMIFPLISEFKILSQIPDLAKYYLEKGPDELGSANLVTSVIVSYRGLDTLGEVTVLFIATAGIGFLLRKKSRISLTPNRKASEILRTGSAFLLPIIFLYGIFIFTHGHLTPGGGFQGGVIIASGILLLMLAEISWKMNYLILHWVESLSGFFYVIIGLLGIFLAAGFLDNRLLPLGDFGRLFSAGAIPFIYSFVGLKVGSELVGILTKLQR